MKKTTWATCGILVILCLWLWQHRTIKESNVVAPQPVTMMTTNQNSSPSSTKILTGTQSQNVLSPIPSTTSVTNTPNTINPAINNLLQKPINFYGKVEDESNSPIAGAQIQFRWDDLTAEDFTRTAAIESDSGGSFSLVGMRGATLSVSVNKEGYYTPHDGRGSFQYANGNPNFFPDPENPVIFHLRKKGQGVSLIEAKFPPGMRIAQLHHDGTPVVLDLISGSQVSEGNGQLELQLWYDISNATKFDWKLQLSASGGGGLIPTDEEFAFQAPQNGYQPSIVIDMPATNQDWSRDFSARYYIQLPNGDYGRFDINLLAHNGAFTVTSVINPTGSQNLEPAQ